MLVERFRAVSREGGELAFELLWHLLEPGPLGLVRAGIFCRIHVGVAFFLFLLLRL